MKVVHVLRKPLSEGTVAANVLTHGTGALNIDASRISTTDSLGGGRLSGPTNMAETCGGPEWDRPWMNDPEKREEYAQRTADKVAKAESMGRWPANLILEHDPRCQCLGAKRVKGIGGGASSGDNAFGQDAGWNAHQNRPTNITRQMDADGMETVEAWECAPGCPVPSLDAQSGISKSSGGRIGNKDGGHIYGGGKGLTGAFSAGDPGFGDTGGASRFYKQVGGQK